MPLAIAVGRRAVLLAFTMVLILGAVLCATAKSSYLAARMILGLCAGQSEALVPMITQVSSYLESWRLPPPSLFELGNLLPSRK